MQLKYNDQIIGYLKCFFIIYFSYNCFKVIIICLQMIKSAYAASRKSKAHACVASVCVCVCLG